MAAVFRTVRVVISGQVQGVWYRGWTVKSARALDLCGWVRNRRDGTVEAVFGGPEPAVEIMLARCHSGPPAARINSVSVAAWDGETGTGFYQLPTI